MSGIFINYRRGDSAGYVGRICDSLTEHFGPTPIFRDIDSIAPGLDFLEQIGQAVGSCDVMLAVIGTGWLTATTKDGRPRLHNPEDYVRLEITEALDRKVRVIPVLVGGAAMPSVEDLPAALGALARRNALELSDSRWEYDIGRLLSTLETTPGLHAAGADRVDDPHPLQTPRPAFARGQERRRGAIVGLSIVAPLMIFLLALRSLSAETLDTAVVNVSFLLLPLIGLVVGIAVGDFTTSLRSGIGGAAIGGLNTLLAWPLGWSLSSDPNLSATAMDVFRSVMLYLPGAIVASGLIGVAAGAAATRLSVGSVQSTRVSN